MQRHWNDQELETYWSFSSDELALIPNREASSRLGVAASLKFFQLEGCLPSSAKDIPSVAIDHMMLRAGEEAGLPFPVHPHMLRHTCGFYLANKGIDTRAIQQYLGHRNIQYTVRYTELAPHRFLDFWDD